jgi:hypothetical protein
VGRRRRASPAIEEVEIEGVVGSDGGRRRGEGAALIIGGQRPIGGTGSGGGVEVGGCEIEDGGVTRCRKVFQKLTFDSSAAVTPADMAVHGT